MSVIEKLRAYNIGLPEGPKPGGSYVSVNVRSKIAYVAIQFPILNGDFLYQGKLGKDVSMEEGYKAMELCALNVLSQIQNYVGLEKIEGLNHFDAYYQASGDFDDAPKVVNGASDLFLKILGEQGQHSRAIFGVERLSKNFCIGLTCTFTLK